MTTVVGTENVFVHLDLEQAGDALAIGLSHHPDILGLQEWPKGRDHLIEATKGYASVRPDHGGGPIVYKTSRYGVLHCGAVVLARGSFVGQLVGRKSKLPDSVATEAFFHDEATGHEIAVLNAHLDAEVQADGKYRTDSAHRPRVRRHKHEVRRIERWVAKQHRAGRIAYVVLDGNFDGLQIKGLVSCWDGHENHAGTLGHKRKPDIVFGPRNAAHVVTAATPSDHDAAFATYH